MEHIFVKIFIVTIAVLIFLLAMADFLQELFYLKNNQRTIPTGRIKKMRIAIIVLIAILAMVVMIGFYLSRIEG